MENKGDEDVEKLKTKFRSAWHNVKYSWALKSKTSFSRNSPVFLLGKCYHFKAEEDEDTLAEAGREAWNEVPHRGNAESFRRDFASRVWLTYREEFPPLPGSTLTSDCGWGCMLRTGQMMLAQALILHFLGRDWTWSEALNLESLDTGTRTARAAQRLVATLESSLPGYQDPKRPRQGAAEEADGHLRELYHRTLVSWFGDIPGAQLGLHSLVRLGLELGKQAGDWYGPAVVAHILKAVEQATEPGLASITAYVSHDCTGPTSIPLDTQGPASIPLDSRAVIILVPVRLGEDKTNPEYFNFVKSVLSLEFCIGVLGGKHEQARYLVGFQDDSLIYMDPHYCQSFVDVSKSTFPLQSYHCPSPKKMPFANMDPSCTIGFYSRTVQDYDRISQELSKLLRPSVRDKYPAFTLLAGHGRDYDLSSSLTPEKREWPFIRDPCRATTSMGDFVLL
uniref:Cysteine protease n=1 Tax=Gadus morhua TaxID=8049 RepID=A0A8C5F9N2_GADMO